MSRRTKYGGVVRHRHVPDELEATRRGVCSRCGAAIVFVPAERDRRGYWRAS